MTNKADKQLLRAVLEPRKRGAIQQITEACAAGADPNRVCPEFSSSGGCIRAGSTLLTHAIHEGASRVVEKLLACGADPNLVDANGWTPWMTSTLVDESKKNGIQDTLLKHGASRDDEHIGELARAIFEGQSDEFSTLLQSDQDLAILSTFRVDLIGHQIRNGHSHMLELLLAHGMKPNSDHLSRAVRAGYLPGVDLVLGYGVPPERSKEEETPLMTAAAMGELHIVQRLVEAGADVNRCAHGNIEWTAAFYARQAGKIQVADWLNARMSKSLLNALDRIAQARDPKFQVLYEHATASESLTTDDIVATLKNWDKRHGIKVSAAAADSVSLEFSSLPENMDDFYKEMEVFCPDICENKKAFVGAFVNSRKLSLWWD